MVPILLCLQSGVWPQGDWILSGMLAVGMIYLPIGVIEVLNYSPLIGRRYLSRVYHGQYFQHEAPVRGQRARGNKDQCQYKGRQVISTISIAVSTIVTTVIVGAGVLLILPFKDFMITTLAPISEYILPSIFGRSACVHFQELEAFHCAAAPDDAPVHLCH